MNDGPKDSDGVGAVYFAGVVDNRLKGEPSNAPVDKASLMWTNLDGSKCKSDTRKHSFARKMLAAMKDRHGSTNNDDVIRVVRFTDTHINMLREQGR